MPTVGSLFAGVEGFGMGLERAGFEVKWQVEIDRDAVSVLERHYPNTHRVRDVRNADPAELEPVDVVTFGSPCQDMSVAGKRAGLAGERSGLFHEAVRIIGGLRPAPAFCIWENVPGALSSAGGRDFGAALDALADAGALDIAWRVLDARWFGVPQRRRRIFLVADFGAERAASVLFESEGGRRDSAACREAGEGAPGDAEDGAGVPGLAYTLPASARGTGDAHGNAWNTTYVPVTGDGVRDAVTCHAAKSGDPSTDNYVVAAPLTAGSHPNSNMPGRRREDDENLVVAITENVRAELRETPYANALATSGGKIGQGYQAVREGMAVRRLTPRECERLMGWPDDWTRYRANGDEISDGPRYRMIGNGVVSNVAEWIGRRLMRALNAAPPPGGAAARTGGEG